MPNFTRYSLEEGRDGEWVMGRERRGNETRGKRGQGDGGGRARDGTREEGMKEEGEGVGKGEGGEER